LFPLRKHPGYFFISRPFGAFCIVRQLRSRSARKHAASWVFLGAMRPYCGGENERSLYYVLGNGQAVRYPVGVGRAGKQWSGSAMINGKFLRPAWTPPPEIKHDKPNLPDVIPGGSGRNPMGAAALTLSQGEYAIHGTNESCFCLWIRLL
jgi:hypothetical protein